MAKTDGLGDTWDEHTPTGSKMATINQDEAFFDDATNGMHVAWKDTNATSRVVSWTNEGNVAGKRFFGGQGVFAVAYELLAKLQDLTKANVTYTLTGVRDEGVILQALEAKTGDWNTESSGEVDYTLDPGQRVIPITSNSVANPTVVTTTVPHGLATNDIILISGSNSTPTIDGSRTVTVTSATTFTVAVNVTNAGSAGTFVRANSSGGGAGYQHVTALSGFTGYVGKVRDSADDVTYADLVTFANVTAAPAAEISTVSGTVDRYLAVDGNVTGSGSITVFIGFARR
jgi:hypothetical protein